MRLSTLLAGLTGPDVPLATKGGDADIAGLTADSRAVKHGFLFAALAGSRTDGRQFIADAVAKGAAAVLVGAEPAADVPAGVALVRVGEPRRALALLAVTFHGPGPDTIVAVTGTSGKTSVAEFTRQIFAHLGHPSASLGTIGVVKPSGAVYGALTTPDPVTLARTLAGLAAEGITHLAMEASSHGLDQHRLDGVRIVAGAFTNLGRDHMDYHPSVEHYLGAKLRLFRDLLPAGDNGAAVINMDGAYGDAVLAVARERGQRLITVGRRGETIRLVDVAREGFKQRLRLATPQGGREVLLPLVGAYQVENALVAAGLVHALDGTAPAIEALAFLKGVPGRLDIVAEAKGGLAVVDYAHKPEALTAALAAVRPFATGGLICVFGCGGDRDRGKRPIMGRIAVEGADVVIVTDDNPRSEVPSAIRKEILSGAQGATEIGDRAEAIRAGMAMLGPGDVLLVAGKGHETGQIVGDKVLPFSDHEEILRAVESM